MQELLELQTGQVSFLSGLMAGFSLTVAANILQVESAGRIRTVSLVLLLLATLLFLIALYVDVRLTIELASVDNIRPEMAELVQRVRSIGTTSATFALVVFIIAIGLLGWLASPAAGFFSGLVAACTLAVLSYVWWQMLIFNSQ